MIGFDVSNIDTYLDTTLVCRPCTPDQYYYGHGKLLLTGEYFVADGALALALPTKVGQGLSVHYQSSYHPKLSWKSIDVNGQVWFEAEFEFWRFNILKTTCTNTAKHLQKLLKAARKQNTHFLRDEVDVLVETKLGFPLDWGLGSSSTLIHNIAQWAYISPFKLAFDTSLCSGYDIACAQSDGPILYNKKVSGPNWTLINYRPACYEDIYFVYSGMKKDSRQGLEYFKSLNKCSKHVSDEITGITQEILKVTDLCEFEKLIAEHEKIVSSYLEMPPLKETIYQDYWGSIKSLGAWGGDFFLATSSQGFWRTKEYFSNKGHSVVLKYEDLILERDVIPSVENYN